MSAGKGGDYSGSSLSEDDEFSDDCGDEAWMNELDRSLTREMNKRQAQRKSLRSKGTGGRSSAFDFVVCARTRLYAEGKLQVFDILHR